MKKTKNISSTIEEYRNDIESYRRARRQELREDNPEATREQIEFIADMDTNKRFNSTP